MSVDVDTERRHFTVEEYHRMAEAGIQTAALLDKIVEFRRMMEIEV